MTIQPRSEHLFFEQAKMNTQRRQPTDEYHCLFETTMPIKGIFCPNRKDDLMFVYSPTKAVSCLLFESLFPRSFLCAQIMSPVNCWKRILDVHFRTTHPRLDAWVAVSWARRGHLGSRSSSQNIYVPLCPFVSGHWAARSVWFQPLCHNCFVLFCFVLFSNFVEELE